MKRRRFLIASGSAILSGGAISGISQEPVMALDFEIQSVEDSTTSNIDSIKVGFNSIDLTPHYIDDSQPATVTITLDMYEFGSTKRSVDVDLTNGDTTDVSTEVNEIMIDGINATQDDSIYGVVDIEVDHPNVQDSLKQSFSYNQSVPSSTGGDTTVEKTINGSLYRLHIFESNGTFSIDDTYENAFILVVGGGGAGASAGAGGGGGGGGAGEVKYRSSFSVSGDTTVTVGSGGTGETGKGPGENGGDSAFGSITAIGGGGGGGGSSASDGQNGGSGGGANASNSSGATGGSAVGDGQGYDGGNSSPVNNGGGGGGGGGAGSSGQNGDSNGADGGDGVDYSDVFGTSVGEDGWFASGGAGASKQQIGNSPKGGGADTLGGNATDGTGGGGASGFDEYDPPPGDGGNGIVIVRLGPL